MTTLARTESPGIAILGLLKQLARQREWSVAALIALTIVIVAIVNRDFLSLDVARNILVAAAPAAIVGCGLTFVIVTGEIDISVGSLMGLCAVAMGQLASPSYANLPVPAAIGLMLLLATSVGFLNGLLVTVGRVPSIIVTLGMLTALRGATELLMNGRWITDLSPGLRFFGTGTFLRVPISLWTTGVVVMASIVLARDTPLGRRIYAVGSSPSAARLAGLSPNRIKLFAFTLTGFLVGVATLVSVPQLSTIESGIGAGFELVVVTAVVVGGTSISGGKGAIIGTLLGVILLGMVRTVLIFLKLGPAATYWERAIQGGFILLAVLIDHLSRPRGRGEEEHA
ncbi:MAG: rhamnose transport system permease protein [Phycisphaerales bacterium]|jgi:ribose/xylose/arabinose/galactoside ABC-type transport system permease subunit|nr:rhamnose transport system permease protein [Phycisphaerales bacterium]